VTWWFSVQSDWKGLADYGTVGLDIVLSILVGFLGGRWLDGKLGAHGWLTVLGFAFGVVAGFRSLYRAAMKMRKQAEADDERERQTQNQDEHRPRGL
jgi:ATP synthase protein I